jgi:hypothetical protein
MKYANQYIPKINTNEGAALPIEEEHLSHLIMANTPNDISFEGRSEHSKKSKIKRLKSNKKLAYEL